MFVPTRPDDSNELYTRNIDVTPELAFQWLERNSHNRPISQAKVDFFTREMKAGRWQHSSQGIAFDTAGLLIDGQHRLWAVIEANVTVRMLVCFNSPPKTRWVLDVGPGRSNQDIINIAGEVGQVTRMHMSTLRAMVGAPAFRAARLAPSEEAALLSRHREAIDFTLEHLGTCATKGVATAPALAVIARAYYSADRGRLAHFCDVLRSGVPADETDHGILALRDFLLGTGGEGNGKGVKRIRYAKTEWALDAFLDGRVPKRLLGSDVELFPLPEETKRTESQAA
jgi:hypothetical protein